MKRALYVWLLFAGILLRPAVSLAAAYVPPGLYPEFSAQALLSAAPAVSPKNSKSTAYDEYPTNGMAIAGFVLSLSGIVLIGAIGSILGIIFSAIALRQLRMNPGQRGYGLAQAGLIIGIVYTALFVVFVAALLALAF